MGYFEWLIILEEKMVEWQLYYLEGLKTEYFITPSTLC